MSRISQRFSVLKDKGRAGLVTFITGGDPHDSSSRAILNSLPSWGADIIELGMPFSDPMADGPAIQEATIRALKAGAHLQQILDQAADFRKNDNDTPLILMGYFNPVYAYGVDKFVTNAKEAGVDGLIIVDLPPEEDAELSIPARKAGLDIIRLVTPTTDDARLDTILEGASGFIYYVSITGITGTATANVERVAKHLDQIRKKTSLPIAVGFGISTPQDVKDMASFADAVVVGSALVRTIGGIDGGTKTMAELEQQVKALSAAL